jgi:glycosyltransferase involved in cell wall biosynthesis
MKSKQIRYSIVVPAYKEADRIADSLHEIHTYLRDHSLLGTAEVIVVTAEASDDTVDIVQKNISIFKNHQHILPGKKVGKGRDVKAGILKAMGEYVVFMDADLATPLIYLNDAFSALESGYDVAIGVRDLRSIHSRTSRTLSSLVLNGIVRLVLGTSIRDTQCGFKAFTRKAAIKIFKRQTINGWGFDVELIAIAKRHAMSIKTIEIPDWHDPKSYKEGLTGEPQIVASSKTLRELGIILINKISDKYR